MGTILTTLAVLSSLLAALSDALPLGAPSASPFANEVDTYRQTHDFDGVAQVRINGSVVYQVASGLADEEFNAPMTPNSIFPIGSNSKLFVSVALYQLQERGAVNLTDPVNLHLNQSDFAAFGFPNQTTWCPRVKGAAPDSPCENVTFVQLLNMGSGVDDWLGCIDVDPANCGRPVADNILYYKGSTGPSVGAFINDLLRFKPGTNYWYANTGYYLLSYLVEKLSGTPLETYIKTKITDLIGFNDTYFDPYAGSKGLRRGYVQEYIHYYAQASSDASAERLATGTCSPSFNSGAVNGAGGFRSTVSDMQRWYLDLFDNRGQTSKVLRPESIRMILERVNSVEPAFGQGIGVGPALADGWPSRLAYCGGVKCTATCMGIVFPANTSDTSLVVSAFSNHQHNGFRDRAAFEAYRPDGFLMLRPEDATNVDDGGAQSLVTAFVHAYFE